MTSQPIPSTSFFTAPFASADQFEAWRERISVVFNVAPLEKSAAQGFMAEALAFHLGELILVRTRFAAQRFVRAPRQLRSDLIDHYLVQFYREGGYLGEVDGRDVEIRPGSVSVLDLARTLETRATRAECISLVVPRDVMEDALPGVDGLHGTVLDDGSGGLLADYLASLEHRLPALGVDQAPHIVRATCDLLAACVRPSPGNLERARSLIEPLQLRQIRHYIDRSLGSSQISPDDICCALQLSRTQLYELFKPFGGVKRYIQSRRLLRIHAALADPAERRPIMAIAECYGFTSHAHLSRAFRQHFGYQPSEARSNRSTALRRRAGSDDGKPARTHSDGPNFDDWVRALRT